MSDWTDAILEPLIASNAIPPAVTAYPSMTTSREKSLLFALGLSHYRGSGVIVDAGLFLGASTNAFCLGIRENPEAQRLLRQRSAKAIQAYDIALWNAAGFDKYLNDPVTRAALGDKRYSDGEDFTPLLKRLLAQHESLIDFRIGDIEVLAHTDESVEIAFYDCLKNYARDLAAFRAFGPYFEAGHTIVVHQDYFYEDAPDLKVRQEFLAPYFRFLGMVATSAVFQLERPIPSEYFSSDPIAALTLDERVLLLRQATLRIPQPAFRLYAEVGIARYLIMGGRPEEAQEVLDEVDSVIARMKLPPRPADVSRATRKWAEGLLRR